MEQGAPSSDNYIDSFGDYVGGAKLYVNDGTRMTRIRRMTADFLFQVTFLCGHPHNLRHLRAQKNKEPCLKN